MPAVFDPLIDIPVHLIEAPRIRLEGVNGYGSLSKFASRPLGEGITEAAVVIG
jgi:hypothetical protein